MSPFDLRQAIGTSDLDAPAVLQVIVRMTIATLLGAIVAYRVWRLGLRGSPAVSRHTAQAQTLIAAAGALMVVVIGDNTARAFGLVGLGAFIRFRAGIRDPRDAAVMFVMIGVGMACGLGSPITAAAATAFVCAVLIVFDLRARGGTRHVTAAIYTEDAPSALACLVKLFPGARVLEIADAVPQLSKDGGRLLVELDLRGDMDSAGLLALLHEHKLPGLRKVTIEE